MHDAWAEMLDEVSELYLRVKLTFANLPEPSTDLAGTSAKGSPPKLPGGDKLAAIGPFSPDAPRDDYPHPLLFLHTWAWHCAAQLAGIPPSRSWRRCMEYLRDHLHLINGDDVAAFHGDLQRTRGNLRRLCNIGRPSQAEEVWEGRKRQKEARATLRDLAERDALPEWIHRPGRRYREPLLVTREEGMAVYPELWAPPADSADQLPDGERERVDKAWERITARSRVWAHRHNEDRDPGQYRLEYVRDEARKVKPT